MKLEESKKAAKILEDAGVDALDVSAGVYDSMATMIEPMSYAEGWKIYLAEEIKQVVKIPVIGVGVIRHPEFGEKILEDGKVDFIALGRALLADPDWPNKAKERREKEIIPCISCNDGCIGGRIFKHLEIRCTCNPWTGRERLKGTLVPASHKKKVFVIGGGPAGMVAALTGNLRGYQVTLYEKSNQLGGQLRLATRPPGKEKIGWYLDYLSSQIKRQRIKVRSGHSATQRAIIQGKPDAVILATGAVPFVPEIPGIKTGSVFSAWEVLEGEREIRDKVVLVAGGGTVGCETALYLASTNKKVILVEMLDAIAMDMEPISRTDQISRIEKSNIDLLLGRRMVRIESDAVILLNKEGEEEQVRAEVVVLALGAASVNDLIKDLKGKVKEIYAIGDSQKPRKIIDAVYEGFQTALRLQK